MCKGSTGRTEEGQAGQAELPAEPIPWLCFFLQLNQILIRDGEGFPCHMQRCDAGSDLWITVYQGDSSVEKHLRGRNVTVVKKKKKEAQGTIFLQLFPLEKPNKVTSTPLLSMGRVSYGSTSMRFGSQTSQHSPSPACKHFSKGTKPSLSLQQFYC